MKVLSNISGDRISEYLGQDYWTVSKIRNDYDSRDIINISNKEEIYLDNTSSVVFIETDANELAVIGSLKLSNKLSLSIISKLSNDKKNKLFIFRVNKTDYRISILGNKKVNKTFNIMSV